MTDNEWVLQSLELLEARNIDIVPGVYRRFYACCPTGKAVFDDYNELVHGKMLNELILAVLDILDNKPYIAGFLEVLVIDHRNYGVEPEMYDRFFDAVLCTLHDALGDQWKRGMAEAWQRQFAIIKQLVESHASHKP